MLEEERRAREAAEAKLEERDGQLEEEKKRVAVLTLERDSYKRQICDLRNTVEYHEAKMEEKVKPAKEPFLSRWGSGNKGRDKKS